MTATAIDRKYGTWINSPTAEQIEKHDQLVDAANRYFKAEPIREIARIRHHRKKTIRFDKDPFQHSNHSQDQDRDRYKPPAWWHHF